MIKYSKREIKQATAISRLLSGLRSSQGIRRVLRQHGFKWIGSGCFKLAYCSKDYPTLVVKVYRSSSDARDDSTKGALPRKAARFFLTPVVHNNHFIIQKKFNKRGGTGCRAEKLINDVLDCSVSDVTCYNCCFHNGKPYFFDYCS